MNEGESARDSNRYLWGELNQWSDGDESALAALGCVESRIALFSCSTDLNWHQLITVRLLVISCDLCHTQGWTELWAWGKEGQLCLTYYGWGIKMQTGWGFCVWAELSLGGSRKFHEIHSSGKREELCCGGTSKGVEERKMFLWCFSLGTVTWRDSDGVLPLLFFVWYIE